MGLCDNHYSRVNLRKLVDVLFLYVIFLIIAIFIKNAFSAIKKTQENLSSLQIRQERQKENIEQLWEQNAFCEALS